MSAKVCFFYFSWLFLPRSTVVASSSRFSALFSVRLSFFACNAIFANFSSFYARFYIFLASSKQKSTISPLFVNYILFKYLTVNNAA